MANSTEFVEWLQMEMKKREWTQADLMRASGLSRGGVSNILNNTRGATPESLVAVARALETPPETVFRIARLLPPKTEQDDRADTLHFLFTQLPKGDQEEIIQIARLKLGNIRSRGKLAELDAELSNVEPDDTGAIMDIIERFVVSLGGRRTR